MDTSTHTYTHTANLDLIKALIRSVMTITRLTLIWFHHRFDGNVTVCNMFMSHLCKFSDASQRLFEPLDIYDSCQSTAIKYGTKNGRHALLKLLPLINIHWPADMIVSFPLCWLIDGSI